jgi:foldase protein PrsA
MNMRKILLAAGIVVVLAAGGWGAWTLAKKARTGAAVAARVNGDAVYWSQVDAEVTRAASQFGMDPKSPEFDKQRNDIQKSVIDQLVAMRIVMQEARKRNLLATDKEVDDQLASIKQRFPKENDFTAALARTGFTLMTLRDAIRANLTQKRLAEVVAQGQVSDDEIRAQFDKNRAQYDKPAQIKVSHILFRVADKSQEAVAQAKVKIVQSKLADGAKFEDLAKQYSDDPGSAQRGGDLGYVGRGSLVKEFEDVAWSLKPGVVSAPVRTQYGLHIIKVYDVKDAQKPDFDKVKAEIKDQLLQSKREKAFETWLEQQRKGAKIERFERQQ